MVKRGGVVISLSGPPDRDFARREGAGLLVGIVDLADGTEGCTPPARPPGRDTNGPSPNPTATSCATSPPWWIGGAIKPVIDREFAFEQLPDALTYLEAGRARGKVVLKVR